MLHCSPYGGVEKLTMLRKKSYDGITDSTIYTYEKTYLNKTYSVDYKLDRELLHHRTLYEEDVLNAMGKQVSLEMDAQLLESVYADTGWVKVGKIREDDRTLIWIRDNVRGGYTRLPNGVYWFQSTDEAAWFRVCWA
jgi:hypothetical protein